MDVFFSKGSAAEDELKEKLEEAIGNDFIVHKEVLGWHLVEGRRNRIDYLLYPKPDLVDRGFDQVWFGIEVKYVQHFSMGNRAKKAKLIWQAISYQQTEFDIQSKNVRPKFVAIYVGEVDEPRILLSNDPVNEWRAMMHLAHFGGVMEITTGTGFGWRLSGPGYTYYSKRNGRGNYELPKNAYVGSIR